MKDYVKYNIGKDVLEKIKSSNDIDLTQKYINDIVNSTLYKDDWYDRFGLTKIINSIDINNRINIIDDSEISLYSLRLIIESCKDEEKIILLKKYINFFDNYTQVKIIASFENKINIKEIFNNCNLEDETISQTILLISDDNIRLDFIYSYIKHFNEIYFERAIESFNDYNIVFNLFKIGVDYNFIGKSCASTIFDDFYERYLEAEEENDKDNLGSILNQMAYNYMDKFMFSYVSKILSIYDYESKIKIIDKYLERIIFMWDEIIASCDDFDESLKLYNRYLNYFSDIGYIMTIIKKLDTVEKKQNIIDLNITKLNSKNTCEIILEIDDIDDVKKMINLNKEILTEQDFIKIVCKKYSEDDKLSILNNDISFS